MSFDILRPQLLWIDGRCYRKYPGQENSDEKPYREEEDEVTSNDNYITCGEEPCDADFDIDTLRDGKLRTTMKIPSTYFGNLIGAKGQVKKRIENETRVFIHIPRFGKEGAVVITGANRQNLASARTRIEMIVDSARQKQAFTHFISIPLSVPAITDAFLEFRSDVLRECDGLRGIDTSIFQNPDKLHLTIGTMPLMDDDERKNAAKILEECSDVVKSILSQKPLRVQLQGIEYMNDDPAEVDVLYAKVQSVDDSLNRLQLIADHLVDRFVGSGLMQRQRERVKLHVTLMNTLFRKDKSGVNETFARRNMHRESFDAVKLLELFENRNFGEIQLSEIHLSQRHSVAKNGYYSCSAKMNL